MTLNKLLDILDEQTLNQKCNQYRYMEPTEYIEWAQLKLHFRFPAMLMPLLLLSTADISKQINKL